MSKKQSKRKPAKRITAKRVQATENLPPPALPQVEIKPEIDEDAWGDDGLTFKQRAFVAAYVGPAAGVASEAAKLAGYRSDNRNSLWATASRLLSLVKVQEAIGHAFARQCDSPEWVRLSIMDLARVTMASFASVDENGELIVDVDKARAAAAVGAIKEIETDTLPGEGPKVIRQKIKLHDRVAVLALAARVQGIAAERHEHTGANGGPIRTKTTFDFSKLSTDELLALRSMRQRAAERSQN
jgi:phage terminase small subunit